MPMARRRMRRRRVARVAVGTAVVAGTAGVVRHHQDKRYAKQDYEEQQMAQAQYDDEPEYDDEPAAGGGSDLTDQLQQLADLHAQGVLSDQEFASAKAKLLG
jgi:Short C-terminal domain